MDIIIKTIPHQKQRYPTLGDYFIDNKGNLNIRVSSLRNTCLEALIAIHELVEALLVIQRGIKIEDIDKFDMQFEAERDMGMHKGEDPGDDPSSPYYNEHFIATNFERQLSKELFINWTEYTRILENCFNINKHGDKRKAGKKKKGV